MCFGTALVTWDVYDCLCYGRSLKDLGALVGEMQLHVHACT